MDAVNVVLILIYAFVFIAEEEKREFHSVIQYSIALKSTTNGTHNVSGDISEESSELTFLTNVSRICALQSISVPNLDVVNHTTRTDASSSILFYKNYGPHFQERFININKHYGPDIQKGFLNIAANVSQERSYFIPSQNTFLDFPSLNFFSASQVYSEFPTLTITSPLDSDRDIWKSYFNVHMNPYHGVSVRADIMYVVILVILVIEVMAGLAVILKHFHQINHHIQRDMDDLKVEVISTLDAMKEIRESVAAKVRQSRIFIHKLEDDKEEKIHAEKTAKALRSEFFSNQEVLIKRLEALEEQFRGSKKTFEDTLMNQSLNIARVVEGVNYKKKLIDMSTQTKVYPKRSGILVKERKNGKVEKKVNFWI